MNIKRAFLAAVAVLMMPGFAMAQSTVSFDVGVEFDGLTDMDAAGLEVEATVSCNAGIPLVQTAMVGQADADRVSFTVSEFVPGSCDVTFADVPYTGWDYDGDPSCLGLVGGETCTAMVIAAAVMFTADVDWTFSDDADVSLADDAVLEMWCDNVSTMTFDASGDSTELPGVLSVMPEDTCYAELTGTGSAIVVDDSDCQDVLVSYGADEACVISAGVFFEGIPTLSQYGMAIMALLMLAVGFVGFRRFV